MSGTRRSHASVSVHGCRPRDGLNANSLRAALPLSAPCSCYAPQASDECDPCSPPRDLPAACSPPAFSGCATRRTPGAYDAGLAKQQRPCAHGSPLPLVPRHGPRVRDARAHTGHLGQAGPISKKASNALARARRPPDERACLDRRRSAAVPCRPVPSVPPTHRPAQA